MPGFANNVDVKDRFAYIACGVAGLQIVDTREPARAKIVGSLDLGGSATDVRIAGDFAYLACAEGGLSVVNISDSANPQVTISIAPDPLTTVTGRVVTPIGTGVANTQVTLHSDNQTTVTDAGGFFEFVGVPTLPFGKAVSVSVEEPIEGYQGRSA